MIKLLRYQEEAVNKLHNGAILHGETGSGKSLTGLAYYKKCWSHLDLYIITTSKKRDSLEWEDEVQKIECNPPKVIDSWNNLKKYRGVKDAFFLFDEHKVGGHGKWAQAMIALSKNNKWILLTATPGDRWDDYATIFIANGFVQNKTAWNNDFCIWDRISKYPKIKGYQHEDILEKMRDAVLVHMEYKSEKVPIPRVISYKVDHEEEQYILARRKSLRHPEMRPFKNISAMFAYMRMNLPVAETKIEPLADIFKEKERTIVFYNFVSEKYEIEKAAITAKKPYFQCNGQIKDPVPTGKEWVYAVQYASGAEAWNCPTCDTIIFYSMNYSYKIMKQAMGRIDRCNSPYTDLYYYYFISPDFEIDQEILEALSRKEKFNEEALANKRFIGYQEDEGTTFIDYLQAESEYDKATLPHRPGSASVCGLRGSYRSGKQERSFASFL